MRLGPENGLLNFQLGIIKDGASDCMGSFLVHPKDPVLVLFSPTVECHDGASFNLCKASGRSSGQVPGKFRRWEAGSKQVPEVPGTVPVSFQIKFSNKLPSMVEPRLDPLRSAGGACNHSTHAPCWPSM